MTTQLSTEEQRAYQANVWKSYLLYFLSSFQLWWPIWVIYLTDYRGFSLTQVSTLEGLFFLVIVLSEVPTGAIADRFGRKTSMCLGAGCTAVAVLVFGLATNFWIVLASYITWGFGVTFSSGADSALMYESLKATGRERDYPRVAGVGFGLMSLGTLGGMLAGAPIAAATNLSVPVLLSAGIACFSLLVALTLREPPGNDVPRLTYRRLIVESTRTAWRLPAVRAMLVLSAVLIAGTNAATVFAQPFLGTHDVPVSMFGVAQAPMRLAGIAGALLAYRLSAAFGLRATLPAVFGVIVGSYVLLGAWPSVYAFGATGTIIFANSVTLPLAADYLNQRIPSAQRATILSLRQLLISLTIISFQPELGVIADHVSLEAVFWASAAFVGATVPVALVFWFAADARERRAEAQPEARVAPSAPG
ncbi:MAG: MFS transporter [Chloroflexi bacterium]|nr:MFS transporter [Chloroflexota bacterium]